MSAELGVSLDDLLFPDSGPNGRSAAPSAPLASASGPVSQSPTAASIPVGSMPALPLQTAGSRKRIRLASGVVWERLTTTSIPNADFLYVTYEVGGASTHEHEFQRHAGQEWGYIISGTLGVTIGFDDYVLGPGDSISFDSMTPHRMHNLGKEPVHGIWFTLGRRGVDVGGAAGQGNVPERPSDRSES
jgi:quercetin dioxygenase-like cupin family protein